MLGAECLSKFFTYSRGFSLNRWVVTQYITIRRFANRSTYLMPVLHGPPSEDRHFAHGVFLKPLEGVPFRSQKFPNKVELKEHVYLLIKNNAPYNTYNALYICLCRNHFLSILYHVHLLYIININTEDISNKYKIEQ